MKNWQEIYDEIGFDEYILMLENSEESDEIQSKLDAMQSKFIELSKAFKKLV